MSAYFFLMQDKTHLRPVMPEAHPFGPRLHHLMSGPEIASVKSPVIAYFDSREGILLDYLDRPAMLVSNALKRIIEAHQEKAHFVPVQLYDVWEKESPLYYLGVYPKVKCLSDKSEFYTTRMIKRAVLAGKKIPDVPVFQAEEMLENRLIFRLDIAEAVLGAGLTGIMFQDIEVV
jgi:hypothetical protein